MRANLIAVSLLLLACGATAWCADAPPPGRTTAETPTPTMPLNALGDRPAAKPEEDAPDVFAWADKALTGAEFEAAAQKLAKARHEIHLARRLVLAEAESARWRESFTGETKDRSEEAQGLRADLKSANDTVARIFADLELARADLADASHAVDKGARALATEQGKTAGFVSELQTEIQRLKGLMATRA